MLRAVSIGLGWWSDELAQAVYGKTEAIGIVSCYSRSAAKRAAFAERFGTATHQSYDAVLADPDIDAVLLTTPHSLHADHVIAAARAGKHVFVEKPVTLTAASGYQAAAACAAAGIVLAVGHNRRFAAATSALKRMVEAGEFGTMLHGEANFSAPGGLTYTPDRWRASRAESPGGAIAGLGVHMIDTMCWILGRVVRVVAQAKRRAVPVDIDDTTSALFAFESGATGYLGTLLACPYTSSVNLYGTKANAFAKIDGDELVIQRAGGSPEPVAIEPVDTLAAELDAFAAACAGRAAFPVAPAEAIHNVEVMQAMVASAAAAGRPVEIGPPP